MLNSVKKKKRDIKMLGGENPIFDEKKDNTIIKGEGCPQKQLSEFPQTLTTFYCRKKDLGAAYERAFNVYSLAFNNMDYTSASKKNPWEITTTLKSNNDVYTIQTRIVKLEDKDVYAFEFIRIQGPPLHYGKIWRSMEDMLLATPENETNPFWDTIDCENEKETNKEESKENDDEKVDEEPAANPDAAPAEKGDAAKDVKGEGAIAEEE